MESRKIVCLMTAAAMALSLIGAAGIAAARPLQDVVVNGGRIDPALQRKVSYGDLNIAYPAGQRVLASRIRTTATDLCWDLNGMFFLRECTGQAVHSTDEQVAQAIVRAKRQMAGLPVGPAIAISMVVGAR
jgi:UrcA family protein